MKNELQNIRAQLKAALDMVDILIKSSLDGSIDVSKFRTRPNGPLSEEGIQEMNRRFEHGEVDGVIAKEMDVSVQGVGQRRKIWEETQNG